MMGIVFVALCLGLLPAPAHALVGAAPEAVVEPAATGTPSPLPAGKAALADAQFRQATALAQAGDLAGATRIYRALAAQGVETASVYWNWAQVAQRRGAPGEALWALLRARELAPGDRAVAREVGRVREACGLDPAEVSPEPLGALGRLVRRLHLDVVAITLALASLLFHALARLRQGWRGRATVAWATAGAALLAALPPLLASFAPPTAVVVQRGAPLADAASPTATVVATLREGEVVPVLERAASYLRIQDASGARGWVHARHVWRLDGPPPAE